MSSSTIDTLVRMANDISNFFRIHPEDQAVTGTADHIRRYWEPRMRAQMAEHLAHGGAGLNPIARKACERVCKPADTKPFPPSLAGEVSAKRTEGA